MSGIDYSINYVSKGFYPITDSQAPAIVQALADSMGGWDWIRGFGLGLLPNVMLNGRYYSFSFESDDLGQGVNQVTPGGTVYVYVYDMSDANSTQSVNSLQQIQDNFKSGIANIGSGGIGNSIADVLASFMKNAGVLALAAIAIYALISSSKK